MYQLKDDEAMIENLKELVVMALEARFFALLGYFNYGWAQIYTLRYLDRKIGEICYLLPSTKKANDAIRSACADVRRIHQIDDAEWDKFLQADREQSIPGYTQFL